MSIPITCPGCHTRFSVSKKFAGKEGPCPKCKAKIKIPELEEELVIHAPDVGPKDSKGRAVLKPITKKQETVSKSSIGIAIAAAIIVPAMAFAVGRMFDLADDVFSRRLLLSFGAVAIAPPIVLLGYSFLRDAELEPYAGAALWIRVLICSFVYALLWGVYFLVCYQLLHGDRPQLHHLVFIVPLLLVPGALGSLATLDLDPTMATIHFAVYLGVCVVLRLTMGLPAF